MLVTGAGRGLGVDIVQAALAADYAVAATGRHPVKVAASLVMRTQRAGLVVTISSTAGIAGQVFCSAYAAAKFGIEGWMEPLAPEVAPFGIPYDAG